MGTSRSRAVESPLLTSRSRSVTWALESMPDRMARRRWPGHLAEYSRVRPIDDTNRSATKTERTTHKGCSCLRAFVASSVRYGLRRSTSALYLMKQYWYAVAPYGAGIDGR